MRTKKRPAPETDMQWRCDYIMQACEAVKFSLKDEPPSPAKEAAEKLAYLVAYLSAIVEKHLRTGEK